MRWFRMFSLLLCCSAFLFVGQLSWPQANFVRPLITQPVNEKQLTKLKDSVYPLARAEFDRGAVQPSRPLERMLLVLKRSPEQETALIRLLDEQQDKSSPNYHKWLTPEEFGKQFGPSDEDMQTVISWLQSHGFQVTQVPKGRTVIEFSGTAAQVQEAFHTSIHKFVVNGESHLANASEVEIPSALAPVVAGPWSLHNFYKKPQSRISKQRINVTYQAGSVPQVTASDGSHFLGPLDYAVIYNINPVYALGINGAGATIGVVGRTEIDASDIFDFKNLFGLGGSISIVGNGPDPGFLDPGEQVEALLDTTWSGAIAPGADIRLVISASTDTTDGVDLSELYIVENNFADIMTESFSTCEGFHTQAEADGVASLAEQAAAQGITYIVSTGDSGASECDRPSQAAATHPISVNLLASTPFNVAVGGTLFNEHGKASTYWNTNNGAGGLSVKTYIPENVWNESCSQAQCGANANLAATGGGASTFFSKPVWQTGVTGIPSDGKRDIPDVSLTAAGHDAYLLCFQRSCLPVGGSFSFFGISGTSASAPSFAGIMALVKQKTGSRQGQANYVLYQMAASQNYSQCNGSSTTTTPSASCKFRDVTVGNNIVPGQTTQKYTSGVGYDLATGLGSPNVANLVNNWIALPGTVTTLGLNPTTGVTHGSSVNVSVSVAPSSGSGTPTGDVSLLTAAGQSIGSFTLGSGSVTATTNDLPGGAISVRAHYAGDGNFGSSDSDPVAVTVSPENSVTTVAVLTADQSGLPVPFTTGPYGSFLYPRADVAAQSGHGTPTGGIQLLDNGNLFYSLTLNSEGNTAPPQGVFTLPPGAHAITATYLGDVSFNQSTSAPVNITITKAATTSTLTASGTIVGHGSSVTLNAMVVADGNGSAPLGTFTFFSGATSLGTVPAVNQLITGTGTVQAKASLVTTDLPLGSDVVTVSYDGDQNFLSSTSAGTTVNVQPEFTPGLSSNAATVSAGGNAQTTITITGEAGFNASVTFACSGLPLRSTCSFNPATVNGSGSTVLTISTTAPRSAAVLPGQRPVYFAWVGTLGGAPLLAVVLLAAPRKRRTVLSALAVLAFLIAGIGCGGSSGGGGGGGGGSPGTPHGTYPVTITATASGGLSHQSTFTLTVQ